MKTTHVSQKALILNTRGEILVVYRTETAPTRPNEWDIPGGELEFGEAATEGMTREILEETGLSVSTLEPFYIETVMAEDQENFWVLVTYHARAVTNDVTLSYEHNDYKWVSPDEFLAISTSPRQKRALEKYLTLKLDV